MTLEAFADTIIPGAKRSPDDHAIAGAAEGGGAVAAGALTLLEDPAGGLAHSLEGLADLLNLHASVYAGEQELSLDEALPAFVALNYDHRARMVQRLCHPDHPEKALWVGLALFSNMAFDSAAHMSTHDALASGHPGLMTIGYAKPNADGVWRFPRYSYGRALANLHPQTNSTGSLA
ncbi:DUF5987 family protein [Catellatospora sp. KI3]|uniref:DUF5987 family protein n=1 Tax=Catellatospora sp. KI3 TaxID=3041620 RepID=UPI00248301FD|nr:DUF5987 family protein [Catellatospora sp. KI3]MDI1461472.1 DUF5987 family protein [Catellatospora sp. KI3]